MKIIFSPTKTQRISNTLDVEKSEPFFEKEVDFLVNLIHSQSKNELGKILKSSEKITEKIFSVYRNFSHKSETGFAIESFTGTSFRQLDIENYTKDELFFMNEHIRVMSALYGVLNPFDEIQKYRLDLGNNIFRKNEKYKNLSQFWGEKIKKYFEHDDVILNLASDEYSKIIKTYFQEKIHSIYFLTIKNGKTKSISMSVKKQRGKMLNYIIKNEITNFSKLKEYKSDNFIFDKEKSDKQNFYFIKSEK